MGDICNMNDLERFLRCPEGQEHLDEIHQKLVGKRVLSVEFTNEVHHIGLNLLLDDGETIELTDPSLDVDALRQSHAEVLDREYYRDHPDQQPP